MIEVVLLPGPPALSRFRLDKLRGRLDLGDGPLYAEFVHLLAVSAPLSDAELARCASLLHYGPAADVPQRDGSHVATVVPRQGTISPWSSKATDIFHICDLAKVTRVERGVRWYMDPAAARRAALSVLFDRMTEQRIDEADLAGVFQASAAVGHGRGTR